MRCQNYQHTFFPSGPTNTNVQPCPNNPIRSRKASLSSTNSKMSHRNSPSQTCQCRSQSLVGEDMVGNQYCFISYLYRVKGGEYTYQCLEHKIISQPNKQSCEPFSWRADSLQIRPSVAASRFAISMCDPFGGHFTQMHIQFLEIQSTSSAPVFNLTNCDPTQIQPYPENQSRTNQNHNCAHLLWRATRIVSDRQTPSKALRTAYESLSKQPNYNKKIKEKKGQSVKLSIQSLTRDTATHN